MTTDDLLPAQRDDLLNKVKVIVRYFIVLAAFCWIPMSEAKNKLSDQSDFDWLMASTIPIKAILK